MGSLTGCIAKAGKLLSREDRAAILESADRRRRDGETSPAAARAAIGEVLEKIRADMDALSKEALDLKVNVSPELKGVFDRMLGGEGTSAANPSRNLQTPAQPALDFTSPAPEPPVDGLAEAAARVGHQDTPQAMREMFGLKDDGSFDEQADIDQYRAMGILDEQDEAMLKLADDAVKAASAYEETLRVAASCVSGGV